MRIDDATWCCNQYATATRAAPFCHCNTTQHNSTELFLFLQEPLPPSGAAWRGAAEVTAATEVSRLSTGLEMIIQWSEGKKTICKRPYSSSSRRE